MRRTRVVLYNPRAVFYTMPLALLAVASGLDRFRFDVEIVDGRLERDPVAAVLAALAAGDDSEGTAILGISVLTGAPIRDALAVSRAVRAARPAVSIVWGGWHPSLFPRECLAEPAVDAVVVGQGEESFAELAGRLASGAPLDDCQGIAFRRGAMAVLNPPRPLRDLNDFPPHDYRLLKVERYFRLKGRRQIDYVSSQGCRFRCGFCADPTVYGRTWVGLEPARVADDLARLKRDFDVEEVAFQDETFFTSGRRAAEIAGAFVDRNLGVSWTATMRADQSSRLTEREFAAIVTSGLTRVMVGVESGSQARLDWMQKDTKIQQVVDAADRCARYGVAATFNFIIGFPGESDTDIAATLALVKQLRSRSPAFDTPIFYYRPYPGTPISDAATKDGYRFPAGLDEWADFDYVGARGPWVSEECWRQVERFKFYARHAWARSRWRWPLRVAARWRCDRDLYAFPIEKHVVEWLRRPERVS